MNVQESLDGITALESGIVIESTSADAVLKIILEKARQLTGADAAQLYQISGSELILTATTPDASPLGDSPLRKQLSLRHSACGVALSTREFLSVPDVRLHTDLYPAPALLGFHSELIAPIWFGHEALGAISLSSRKPNHFSPQHASLAKAASEQAAVAIVHADLLAQLSELRNVDAAILTEGISFNELAAIILQGIRRLTAAEFGQILILHVETRTLEIVASTAREASVIVPLDDSVCGSAVLLGRPVLVTNWKKDEQYRQKFKDLLGGTLSELAVPVSAEDITLVLNVESPREGAFSPHHERVLLDFAKQTLIAVRHFTRIRESIADSEALTRIAADLASCARLEKEIYQRTMDAAISLTGCSFAQVLVRQGQKLRVEATTGTDLGAEIDIALCASGHVLSRNLSVIFSNDLELDPIPNFRQWLPVKTESLLMAGFGVGERYVGVLNLESGRKYHFTERHRRLIARLVDCVAIALRINRSYRGLRQVAHDLSSYGGALGNFAKVIAEDARDPTERSSEAVAKIGAIGNVLCDLREDILPRQPDPVTLLVQDVLPDVIDLVQVREISRMPEGMVLPPVVFDHEHLRRVLIHLLTNSKQALDGVAGPLITIDGGLGASERLVQVRITDNGVGMTPDQKDRAFELGYSRRVGKKGSGLGLSFCREIMTTGHGGIDIVQTAPGVGTTVEVSVPVATAAVFVRQDSALEGVALLSDDSKWVDVAQRALGVAGIASEAHSRLAYLGEVCGHEELPAVPVVFVDLRGRPEESSRFARAVLCAVGASRRGARPGEPHMGTGPGFSEFATFMQFPSTPDLLCDVLRQAIDRSKGS